MASIKQALTLELRHIAGSSPSLFTARTSCTSTKTGVSTETSGLPMLRKNYEKVESGTVST